MTEINAGDKVRIVEAPSGEERHVKKTGRVVMISDGENCLVALDEGGMLTATKRQLKKLD